MTAPRRWFRFSLRTMLVGVPLLACWLGYSMNWISQRRAMLTEGKAIEPLISNYVCAATMDEIPAVGSTIPQWLLAFLGERSVEEIVVFYIVDEHNECVVTENGCETRETVEFPKIKRARQLFPEAKVVAVFFERRSVQPADGINHELAGMISE